MTGYATRTPELYKLSKVSKFRYETRTSPNNSNYHYTVGRDRKDKNSFFFFFFFPFAVLFAFSQYQTPFANFREYSNPYRGKEREKWRRVGSQPESYP